MPAPQESVDAFVERARAALPNERITSYKIRHYGSREIGDAIIALVKSGEKTGTFSLAAEFEGQAESAPALGDHYVVTAFDGTPALLLRITAVELVPFVGISHEHVQVEGPKARSVAVWRKIHWEYWGAGLRTQGKEPSEDMPVIFQRFELLFPKS
ncbi:MAG: ASCH domain-containing protein [Steroidobacteraceae bacterium]|jgi:uncharacterized protein YhfF